MSAAIPWFVTRKGKSGGGFKPALVLLLILLGLVMLAVVAKLLGADFE